ncbi:MAG: response regulator transcription factor [Clostridiaceae bacterium]|nr:response regulator transcription factor [Clostridiaceae bacterium]MBW4859490.1 response regulator transcription factor [Clostridiaceae bacterium]MBW4867335.1 response regulator transcription factor [Clostridiaceae bacterium]
MKRKILIVDDEIDLVNMLQSFLNMKGYEVITALDGREVLEKLNERPDLILLDVNMPQLDGFKTCQMIRDKTTIPVLFLTARTNERDRVKGLMIGGDDYITKPFSLAELLARIHAHLMRENRKGKKNDTVSFGELWIDYSGRRIFYRNQEVVLTKTEFDIIELLSLNSGRVFDREHIYTSVWGYDGFGDSSVIAEHVRRIRGKLSRHTDREYIETVWGVGYRWIG